MLYPEISKLMEGMDSRYSLVIATAKRARQLAADSADDKTVSRAINEIANGKIRCVKKSEEAPLAEIVEEATVEEEVLAEEGYLEKSAYEDARIIFEDVINKLPPEEKVLIDMYYKQDMNKKEIAEALVLTQMSVTRKMKQAFELIADLVVEKKQKDSLRDEPNA